MDFISKDHISIKTKIGQVDLDRCTMNASGCNCQFIKDLNDLDNSRSGAIISKSCSIDRRIGNELPRYYHNQELSINSMGLPNEGYKYYIDACNSINKPYFMSISSQAVFNQISIIEEACKSNISAVELNVSCPNIAGDPQLSYSFSRLDEFLRKVFEYSDYNKTIGLKLSPYYDISHFNTIIDILNNYKSGLSFLTCINGVGNGLFIDIDKEETVIKPKNGLGGMGGSIVKPTGLANVNIFANNTNFDIIGCGGITNGDDAFEYILCGSKAIQIGTQLIREGNGVFTRIENELKDIMLSKGYYRISDFQNKLKYK